MESHVFTIANLLNRRNHDVHVLTGSKPDDEHGILPASPVPVHRLPFLEEFCNADGFFFEAASVLFEALRDLKPDVIHAHDPFSFFLLSLISEDLGSALFLSYYWTFENLPPVRAHRHWVASRITGKKLTDLEVSFMKFIVQHCPCERIIITDAGFQALGEFLGMPESKIAIVESGVDLDRFFPRPPDLEFKRNLGMDEDVPVVLAPARVFPRKGLDVLLLAFAKAQIKRSVLVLTGAPSPFHAEYAELIDRQVEALQLRNRVKVLRGRISYEDMPRLYSIATVVAVPSVLEFPGIALLEAMACGRPVISSDIPSIRRAVKHGETGILVPYGSTTTLSLAIDAMLQDEALRDTLSQNALIHIRNSYDARQLVENLERVYMNALSEFRFREH